MQDAIETRATVSGYDALPPAEKTIYVIWWLEAEVNNGGFDQYFFNSAGDQASDVPPALERIGAPGTAELVRRALAVFPGPGPAAGRFVRQKQLEALPNRDTAFDSLNDSFYEYPENLEQLLVKYARANSASLSTPWEAAAQPSDN